MILQARWQEEWLKFKTWKVIRLEFVRECNHNKVFLRFLTTIFIKFDWVHSHPVDFWAVRAFINFKQVLYISKAHKIFELSGIRARAVSVSGFIKLRQYMMTRRLQILDDLCVLHSTNDFRKHKLYTHKIEKYYRIPDNYTL